MWIYRNSKIISLEQVPQEAFGFIYLIIDKTNNMKYIGKKQILSNRRTKISKKEQEETNNRRKKFKVVSTESNWLTYTGSCKELNEAIKNGANIEKHILEFAFSKRALTYLESKKLFQEEVLEKDEFYNSNIDSRHFRGKIT